MPTTQTTTKKKPGFSCPRLLENSPSPSEGIIILGIGFTLEVNLILEEEYFESKSYIIDYN